MTDSVVTKYYGGAAPESAGAGMRKDGALSYLLSDHLGSNSLILDTAGNVVGETRYTAWGEERFSSGSVTTDYTYTGQYSNTDDFGLMYYKARWYDPVLGRFAQADSIVPGAGNPIAWDRYAYVKNNPVRYSDPSGHCFGGVDTIICVVLFVAVVVAITSSMDQIEMGTELVYASQTDPRFRQEQEAYQNWQDNCRGSCHYGNVDPGFVSSDKPETPLTDQYSSGYVDIMQGTITIAGSVYAMRRMSVGMGEASSSSEGILLESQEEVSRAKSIRSLEKNLAEHQQKLQDYIENPWKYDNKGFLANAPSNEIREKIYNSRIEHLQQEIQNFMNQIDYLKGKQR